MPDLPIACTLGADEYPQRLARIRALGEQALLSADTRGLRATLRFRPDPGISAELAELVTAEAKCCAFLTMTVSRDARALTLTIDAPEGGESVLVEFVDAFAGASHV